MSDADRQRLLSERGLLLASLRDAAEEHDAGELDDETFTAITERDRARLAAIAEEIDRLDEAAGPSELVEQDPHEARGAKGESFVARHRLATVAVSCVVIVAVIVGIVVGTSSPAPSKDAQITSLLNQADQDVQQNKVAEAIEIYDHVLTIDPTQAHALAEAGWLTYSAGVSARSIKVMEQGETQVRGAVRADPSLFAAHLYLGAILLLSHDDPKGALAQFEKFLALKPPASWVKTAEPYLTKAAQEAGVPVPTAPS
jgi:tetratricopeptide (TPR) repeat protein